VFGSTTIDVGIGLIFVYLMLSLVCTAANEALASAFAWRADTLHDGIHNLVDGDDKAGVWTRKFYEHPLVRSLYRGAQKPSYIPSRTFALAVLDLVLPRSAGAKPATAAEMRAAIAASPAPDGLKSVLLLLVDEAERSSDTGRILRQNGVLDIQKLDTLIEQVYQHIEGWFNTSMERVSGWYKRRVHVWTIGVALVLTGLLNIDSVQIANHLSRDPALRSAIVAQAEVAAKQPQPASGDEPRLQTPIQELKSVGIPLGWPDVDGPQHDRWGYLLKILGLLLTAGAASLGAPFWFDVLNKFMSIRSAGKAPEETPKSPKQIPLPEAPGHVDAPIAGKG